MYFLTEISENDLLNVTGTDYETLGQDMAVADGALTDGTGYAGNAKDNTEENITEGGVTSEDGNVDKDSIKEEKTEAKKKNPTGTYIFLGVAGIIFIAAMYFFKTMHRKNENFEDDGEEENGDYEEEIYESEEDTEDGDSSFFDGEGNREE